MTTQNFTGIGVPELRAMLRDAVGLPVGLNISNITEGWSADAVAFDVERVEATKAGGFMLTCQYDGCAKTFESARPDAKYHTDNCRLKAFRAAKRAELQAELDAAGAGDVVPQHLVDEANRTAGTPDLAQDLIDSLNNRPNASQP